MKNRAPEQRYVGVPEFAAAAAAILNELGLIQERGTVTDVPDERTVRYYLSEGLIQTPEEKQGTASVFTYLHLLQLLAVKKLQAEHLPIRKIRELVAGRSERELERLIGIGQQQRKESNEATRYLESLLTKPPPPPSAPLAGVMASMAKFGESDESRSWQRVEIEPGLELHIRSDYEPPAESRKKRSLLDRIAGLIKSQKDNPNKEN